MCIYKLLSMRVDLARAQKSYFGKRSSEEEPLEIFFLLEISFEDVGIGFPFGSLGWNEDEVKLYSFLYVSLLFHFTWLLFFPKQKSDFWWWAETWNMCQAMEKMMMRWGNTRRWGEVPTKKLKCTSSFLVLWLLFSCYFFGIENWEFIMSIYVVFFWRAWMGKSIM